jgi:hypothetical protein
LLDVSWAPSPTSVGEKLLSKLPGKYGRKTET